MQEMYLYSSIQTTFRISKVISDGYFPVSSLKPNLS